MKHRFSILNRLFVTWVIVTACITGAFAQSETTVASTQVTIRQDEQITDLLAKYKEYNANKEVTDGYRLQIMYTDVRDEVYQKKGELYSQFPDLASYVEYEQPYYKLRIGDFRSRLEATYYLQQVTMLYSGAFIVKDKVKIKKD